MTTEWPRYALRKRARAEMEKTHNPQTAWSIVSAMSDAEMYELLGETEPTCGWRCGDPEIGHKHYTVIVRQDGKLLGRVAPKGSTTNRKIFASVLSKARAEIIAADINDGTTALVPGLTAKVAKF